MKKIKNYIHSKLYAYVHITKDESGLCNQLLINFRVYNSCKLKQVTAEVRNGVFYKNIALIRKPIFHLSLTFRNSFDLFQGRWKLFLWWDA